jgi:hypothetical protein
MPADVRINQLTTDVNVTDASAMLTPQVLERIVQVVLKRLEEQQRSQRDIAQEQSLGSGRQMSRE